MYHVPVHGIANILGKCMMVRMSRHRVDSLIGKSVLADIRARALQLSRLNKCLIRQLPLSINTVVKLADIDTHKRAVIHVKGGEWATHVRMQQRMVLAILKSCGLDGLGGIVVKNRPLKDMAEDDVRPRQVERRMSDSARDLVAMSANDVSDERLARSLRRLARRR